jgi:hypothetical protein
VGTNTYISIGNSDDRLPQADWSGFIAELRDLLYVSQSRGMLQIHGEWFAAPDQPWQNANWCVEILPPTWWRAVAERNSAGLETALTMADAKRARSQQEQETRAQLKDRVRRLCTRWRQDSFAWTTGEVSIVETGYVPPTPDEERQAEMRNAVARELAAGSMQVVDQERLREELERERERWREAQAAGLTDNRSVRQGGGYLARYGKTALQRALIAQADLDQNAAGRSEAWVSREVLRGWWQGPGDIAARIPPATWVDQAEREGWLPKRDMAKDGREVVMCTDESCLVNHPMSSHHVVDSAMNQAQAKIEDWGDLKELWRDRLWGTPTQSEVETAGEGVQEKSSEVDTHGE